MSWLTAFFQLFRVEPLDPRVEFVGQSICVIKQCRPPIYIQTESLQIDDIYKVMAGKTDAITIELIWLMFLDSKGEVLMKIDDLMPGFKTIADELPEKFPGIEEGWWPYLDRAVFNVETIELWERNSH